jgi:hypothetical protein
MHRLLGSKAYRQKPIENPDSYLASGVMWWVRRLLARERRIEQVGSLEELESFPAAQDTKPRGSPGLKPAPAGRTRGIYGQGAERYFLEMGEG